MEVEVDRDRYVVFCVDGRKYGRPGYAFFTHEADVMMAAVANEVRSGKLTPAEARELLESYREVLPPLFTGEQRMVFDPSRNGWDDPDSFPRAEAVLASPQASQIFWYEVDELGIDGLTLVWSTPFPVLAPVSEEGMKRLREAVSDEYDIVVKETLDEYDATKKNVEWARKLIEEAKAPKDPRRSRHASETGRPYGSELVRQALEDPAFDAGRYIDDDIKDLQSGDLVRICLVENALQANLMEAVGVVVSTSGGSCTLDVDGQTHVFERWAIELMPTGFNPHYDEGLDSEAAPASRASSPEIAVNRTQLVYGDGGAGLVFLEENYARDIGDFREALYKASTWGDLGNMVSEERYRETVEAWMETEEDRLEDEDDTETEVTEPELEKVFDAEEIHGYADGDWPEMAQRAMTTWVESQMISDYGRYVETIFNGFYPVIEPENEEKVVSLLEEQGYTCTRDDDLVWKSIWGG